MKKALAVRVACAVALVVCSGATAAVFKVGPGGTHATIQAAIDAAVAAGGDNEVRVATGTYAESVTVPQTMTAGTLVMTGGWDAPFGSRAADPALTKIDGGGTARVGAIYAAGGEVRLEGFTIRNGLSTTGNGGGLLIVPRGAAVVRLVRDRIAGNEVRFAAGSPEGGGVYCSLQNSARLFIQDSVIESNAATSDTGSTAGGGVDVEAGNSSYFWITGTSIAGNRLASNSNQCTGGGLFIYLADAATGELTGNTVRNNSSSTGTAGAVLGAGGALWVTGTSAALLTAARNVWLGNSGPASTNIFQLSLIAQNDARLAFLDSVVAPGAGQVTAGIDADSRNNGNLNITNCTIADHAGDALGAGGGSGALSVYNTIIFNNGNDTLPLPRVSTGANLIGVDPLFVNPAAQDYSLQPVSPAIDGGTNQPPGGLGSLDVAANPRVQGTAVDIGAYELQTPPLFHVPAIAHTIGFGGTQWRSSVAIVNMSGSTAHLDLRYISGDPPMEKPWTLPSGDAVEWRDVLIEVFGIAADAKTVGALEITSDVRALAITARNYADNGPNGTYGQFYPAVAPRMALSKGAVGVLPRLKNNASFYTNVGGLNIGTVACDALIKLFDQNGSAIGTPVTLSVPARSWAQRSKIFDVAGAGARDTAYATVEILTPGAAAWIAASVIDATTKDPTTIPAVVPAPAGATYRLAGVAHTIGFGNTQWRTSLGIVNRSGGDGVVNLKYHSGGVETAAAWALGANTAGETYDVLTGGLFTFPPDARTVGSIEISSDKQLAITARNYADTGGAGTYGQFFPALLASDAMAFGFPAVLPLVKKNAGFYTNVGALNLGLTPCTFTVRLVDGLHHAIGTPVSKDVAAGEWVQVNDVFAKTGAGSADTAYALVDITDASCKLWSYASVIDLVTRDPTTVMMIQTMTPAP